MTPPAEIVIQKSKVHELRIPRVRLSNVRRNSKKIYIPKSNIQNYINNSINFPRIFHQANERILNPAIPQVMTPMEKIHSQIKDGVARKRLKPVVIVIDDD